jgi:hypothetical protein
MPNFDPELVQLMRHALDEIMKKVPLEYATPGDQGVSRGVHSQGRRARSDELRCADGGGRESDPDHADPLQLNFWQAAFTKQPTCRPNATRCIDLQKEGRHEIEVAARDRRARGCLIRGGVVGYSGDGPKCARGGDDRLPSAVREGRPQSLRTFWNDSRREPRAPWRMAQAARGLVVVGEMTGLPRLRARRLPFLRRAACNPLPPGKCASLNSVRKLFARHLAREAQRSQPRSLFP